MRIAIENPDGAQVSKIDEILLEDTAERLLKNDEIRKSFLGE